MNYFRFISNISDGSQVTLTFVWLPTLTSLLSVSLWHSSPHQRCHQHTISSLTQLALLDWLLLRYCRCCCVTILLTRGAIIAQHHHGLFMPQIPNILGFQLKITANWSYIGHLTWLFLHWINPFNRKMIGAWFKTFDGYELRCSERNEQILRSLLFGASCWNRLQRGQFLDFFHSLG